MLSVIPASETSPTNGGSNITSTKTTIISPQRNLSLNLQPSITATHHHSLAPVTTHQLIPHTQDVEEDAMQNALVGTESYDERSRLLNQMSPTLPQGKADRQHSSSSNNNNNSIDEGEDTFSLEATTEVDESTNSEYPRQITTTTTTTKKPKQITKLATKTMGLKRVSFGSSKGSMVETLVFETPTPLSEHVEHAFGFEADGSLKQLQSNQPHFYAKSGSNNMDDSGIEVQEESERSIVRVSIYQSSQPQQICPPAEYLDNLDGNLFAPYNSYDLDDIMTATVNTTIPGYDRQQSTDSGWDNPFRPGGDLSREADEIVNMIRGGKPITPTEDHAIGNGNAQKDQHLNGTATTTENVTKTNVAQTQSAQNGTKIQSKETQSSLAAAGGVGATGKTNENNGVTSLGQVVSKQVVPGPTSASHVVIEEKKNKKKGCCVVQ